MATRMTESASNRLYRGEATNFYEAMARFMEEIQEEIDWYRLHLDVRSRLRDMATLARDTYAVAEVAGIERPADAVREILHTCYPGEEAHYEPIVAAIRERDWTRLAI